MAEWKENTFTAIALLLAIAIYLYYQSPEKNDVIDGSVQRVIDGDTFVLDNGTKIRLCGIDAPGRETQSGQRAKSFLRNKIDGERVSCRIVGSGTPCDDRSKSTSYDRTVAQCFYGGDDIATILVAAGHAKDWHRFSGGHYQ